MSGPTQMYLNLPVKDLDRSKAFFADLGYGFEPNYTDEKAACLILAENMFVMLLSEAYFKGFTKKAVADAHSATEAIIGLSAQSRSAVDSIVKKALAAGGSPANEPYDYGKMYGWSFNDPDGHQWEYVWMADDFDPKAI